jgi:di/tricarboxylate transporter
MTFNQALVFAVLAAALVLFVWGRWRYDLVALGALLALVVPGIVEADRAFLGFGHPAVVTVAAVLVVSRGLERSGFVGKVARSMEGLGPRPILHLSALTTLVAVSSAFMNNVGALALFMPVAIRAAREHDRPASLFLMPLAFGSLLGGLTTLIGTPPNIIIATFRAEHMGEAFGMFDFAPVGAGVTLAGLLFIALGGWRLLPERRGEARPDELFEMEEYLSEVRIPEGSRWVGRALHEIVPTLEVDVNVIGIVRGEAEIASRFHREPLRVGDVLVVEIEPGDLDTLVAGPDLEAEGAQKLRDLFLSAADEEQEMEGVVRPDGRLSGRTAEQLQLRARHGVNLLGVARQGRRVRGRLRDIAFRPGDVLLLQGAPDAVLGTLASLGGLPLAERGVDIGRRRRLALAVGIFAGAITLTVAGFLPVQVSLTLAALAMVTSGTLTLQAAYESIQWPVIILLGAMLPVGEALESTGAAASVAGLLLRAGAALPPEVSVAALMVGTMLLSNVVNNAAAAILMAPIAIALAVGLESSPDPFLMAVAVGASCAFLTPIGHQSNTLVMGPGGYRFGDYLYLGLPLTGLVALVSIPLILLVWPL